MPSVSKEEFLEYEEVRLSGEINMWDVKGIISRTSLNKDQITDIMKNYATYYKQWGE